MSKIQNFAHKASHTLYTGQSGTGKTTKFIADIQAAKARWKFVYDAKGGEIGQRFKLPICRNVDELVKAVERTGWVVYNPSQEFPGRRREGFAFFCDFVWNVATRLKGKKLFCGDELQNTTHKNKPTLEFQVILDEGRSYELDTYFVSSAPNRIYCDHRSQFNRVLAFRQLDGNATEFLKEAGIDAEKISNLKNGEYLWRNTDTGEAGEGGAAF